MGEEKRKERARTIYDPVSFAVFVLAKWKQLEVFLAVRVRGRRRRRWHLVLLMFIMDNAPRAVYDVLDLGTVTEL